MIYKQSIGLRSLISGIGFLHCVTFTTGGTLRVLSLTRIRFLDPSLGTRHVITVLRIVVALGIALSLLESRAALICLPSTFLDVLPLTFLDVILLLFLLFFLFFSQAFGFLFRLGRFFLLGNQLLRFTIIMIGFHVIIENVS